MRVFPKVLSPVFITALTAAGVTAAPASISAQEARISAVSSQIPSYADIADLSESATIVARAQVRKVSRLKPEQAVGVKPGWARVYIEAKTSALLVGGGLGESIKYLADIKLDEKGALPKLRKAQVIVFANAVPGRPGELRLVAPDAMLVSDAALEQRVRSHLTERVAPDAAPKVTGVHEAMHVPGNLAGEGETQVFMATAGGNPVSVTVVRRPGSDPMWGVSLSEIVDQAAKPPARDTLTWYRLACFLPRELPREAVLSGSAGDRRLAAEDYRFVIGQLGQCTRTRSF